jgi:DNA integrity scanning protein DisA with diadenylate cyclase activity
MTPHPFTKQFERFFDLALKLSAAAGADAILVMADGPLDWRKLKERAGGQRILLAADSREQLDGAGEIALSSVILDMPEAPVHEKLTQALLECVADDLLRPGAAVVAVYSGFEAGKIDSISQIELHEHLGRLTVRDLQNLETHVPLETLRAVVDLAVEIGREGREGKPVGAMFVVGETRKVLAQSHPAGFDPVKGYSRKDRNLRSPRAREGIKEIAQLDGAFIVAPDGVVEASCRLIDTAPVSLTLSKGLGSRHWAGAAISKNTRAIAVVVSQSNGTVRIFQHGEVVLRIEPFRRAMKWRDFDFEPPAAE